MVDTYTEEFETLLRSVEGALGAAKGSVITGKVVAVSDVSVTVDAGLKALGSVSLSEFKDPIKQGDSVDIYIEKYDEHTGFYQFSRDKALKLEVIAIIEQACKNKDYVMGKIVGPARGGCAVDMHGVAVFLPGSQIDVRPLRDISSLIGKEQPFAILKVDRERSNIVVSRKAVIADSTCSNKDEILRKYQIGTEINGTINAVKQYGYFVGIGDNLDALLHNKELSWRKDTVDRFKVYEVGDTIKAIVKNIEFPDGLKGEMPRIYLTTKEALAIGDKFRGTVKDVASFGIIVEFMSGIEGLVHAPEISWTKKYQEPSTLAKIGDEVDVVITQLQEQDKKIFLSMKRVLPNPWYDFRVKYAPSTVIDGVVSELRENFGIVTLQDGLQAIIDLSELKELGHKPGDKVRLLILDCDVQMERIVVSIKRLNLLDTIKNENGVVASITQDGAIVVSASGLVGLVPEVSEINLQASDSVKISVRGIVDGRVIFDIGSGNEVV